MISDYLSHPTTWVSEKEREFKLTSRRNRNVELRFWITEKHDGTHLTLTFLRGENGSSTAFSTNHTLDPCEVRNNKKLKRMLRENVQKFLDTVNHPDIEENALDILVKHSFRKIRGEPVRHNKVLEE